MPRMARNLVPGYPHHIIHRGHNRQKVFYSASDQQNYFARLISLKQRCHVGLYGFCLMTNHVHLILTPGTDTAQLSRMMKLLAGGYTQFINRRTDRSGTLWEGRYRSSPIHSDDYLLACSRYIDLNPVRAGIVDCPEQYQFSSYRTKAGLETNTWLDNDPCYQNLSVDLERRAIAYRDFVAADIPRGETQAIRDAVNRGIRLGTDP